MDGQVVARWILLIVLQLRPSFCYEDKNTGLAYNCPVVVQPALFYSGAQVEKPAPNRALRTVPSSYVYVQPSSIPDAGLGVFASIFLKKGTWLAEYEGDFLPLNTSSYTYAWLVTRHGQGAYFVDAADVRTSNWVRYVNMARHVGEQNVWAQQCAGRVYYMLGRDVRPGQELLTNYGYQYGRSLGIDLNNYHRNSRR